MAKAISYIRFSASHQGRGSTVERQSAYINEWIDKNPKIKLSNISAKDEGRSGYKGEHLNHGLGKIRRAIESGEIQSGDYILVEAIDRIGRLKPMVMMGLIHEIVSKGVLIITLEDDTEYSIDSLNDNHSALFILIGKIQQAHNYSKSLSNRISSAYERKRREARSGQSISKITPYWLTSKGKIIPERGEIIKLCINLYLEGHSANSILKELSSKHPEFKKPHPETFKKWFKHKALIGIWDNQGDPIEDVFEPLIDKELFYTLQREIERRYIHMSPPTTYGLSGLVVCELCTAKFYFRTKKHKDYTIVYSNCSNYLKHGKSGCTNNKTWPYEVLKVIAKATTNHRIIKSVSKTFLSKHTGKLIALQEELKDENSNEEKYLDALKSLNESAAIKDRIATIHFKQKKLRAQIREVENQLSSSSEINDSAAEDLMARIKEARNSPRLKQKILLASGYQISINNNLASICYEDLGIVKTFKLVRRSTKYNCYLVQVSIGSEPLEGKENMDGFPSVLTPSHMIAINRAENVIRVEGSDINNLLNDLEELKT
jgi:DNA invertase Pin-like site-specific DNA recombinase